MNLQSVFNFYSALAAEAGPVAARTAAPRRAADAAMPKMEYDMLLTRAPHRHTLSHPVYAVLVATAHGQFHQERPAAIAGIAARLGTSYHTVVWHLRKYPDLFLVDQATTPFRLTLTTDGQRLLADIHKTLHLYRSQPAAP